MDTIDLQCGSPAGMGQLIKYFESQSKRLDRQTVHCHSSSISSEFESLIKFQGVPILPPALTSSRRDELLQYKKDAILLERRQRARRQPKAQVKISEPRSAVRHIQFDPPSQESPAMDHLGASNPLSTFAVAETLDEELLDTMRSDTMSLDEGSIPTVFSGLKLNSYKEQKISYDLDRLSKVLNVQELSSTSGSDLSDSLAATLEEGWAVQKTTTEDGWSQQPGQSGTDSCFQRESQDTVVEVSQESDGLVESEGSSPHHSGQSGHPSGQSGHPSGQSGHPSGQSGHPSGQSGHPSGQSGHPSGQSGHPSGHSGHPSGQSGHTSGHSGHQSSQSGHSNSQPGCGTSQTGNPNKVGKSNVHFSSVVTEFKEPRTKPSNSWQHKPLSTQGHWEGEADGTESESDSEADNAEVGEEWLLSRVSLNADSDMVSHTGAMDHGSSDKENEGSERSQGRGERSWRSRSNGDSHWPGAELSGSSQQVSPSVAEVGQGCHLMDGQRGQAGSGHGGQVGSSQGGQAGSVQVCLVEDIGLLSGEVSIGQSSVSQVSTSLTSNKGPVTLNCVESGQGQVILESQPDQLSDKLVDRHSDTETHQDDSDVPEDEVCDTADNEINDSSDIQESGPQEDIPDPVASSPSPHRTHIRRGSYTLSEPSPALLKSRSSYQGVTNNDQSDKNEAGAEDEVKVEVKVRSQSELKTPDESRGQHPVRGEEDLQCQGHAEVGGVCEESSPGEPHVPVDWLEREGKAEHIHKYLAQVQLHHTPSQSMESRPMESGQSLSIMDILRSLSETGESSHVEQLRQYHQERLDRAKQELILRQQREMEELFVQQRRETMLLAAEIHAAQSLDQEHQDFLIQNAPENIKVKARGHHDEYSPERNDPVTFHPRSGISERSFSLAGLRVKQTDHETRVKTLDDSWSPRTGDRFMPSQQLGRSLARSRQEVIVPPQAHDPAMALKFARVTAVVKGYLTRCLLRSDKVQELVKTIRDTREFAFKFQTETPIKTGQFTAQDRALLERIVAQLQAALLDIHDIFFEMPSWERMSLIHQTRMKEMERKVRASRDSVRSSGPRISQATLKALERKRKAREAEASAMMSVSPRPRTAPTATSSPRCQNHTDIRALRPLQGKTVVISPIRQDNNKSDRPSTAPDKQLTRPKRLVSQAKSDQPAQPTGREAGSSVRTVQPAKSRVNKVAPTRQTASRPGKSWR